MAQLTLTRRSFMKAMAVTGAAASLTAVAEPMQALAEGVDADAGEVKRVRSCCRACGKVECGVWVTVRDGKVVKVEGDESAPQSRGHCCSKSQSSMQALYHPDRLRFPVKRTNPKGEDDPGWVRITLDEAFEICGEKLKEVKEKYGGESIFVMCGTSRVWSLGPYQGMKQLFGTPNAHLAYQVCKGPRHFGGIMTDEMGSPWMEVEAEPSVYVQWGTACEYSNYDSTNRTVTDVAHRASKHIVVDPRVTPLGKEADIWLPLRPGTDGALALSWLNWVIENEAYDDTMVRRWSNASFLYVDDKPELTEGWLVEGNGGINMKTKLLTEADLKEDGKYQRFIVWDEANERLTYWDAELGKWEGEEHRIPTTGTWIEHPYKPLVADAWLPDQSTFADPATEPDRFPDGSDACNPKGLPKRPALLPGEVEVTLKDGSVHKARTVWDAFHELTSEYTMEKAEEVTGVPAAKNEEAVRAWTTRINPLHGNGGIHFQLATDQNGNSIQNVRALQILSCITGNSDEPAGNRGSSKAIQGVRTCRPARRTATRPRCGTAATSTSKGSPRRCRISCSTSSTTIRPWPSATATRCPAMRKPSLSPSAWAAHSARRRRGRTPRPCSSDKPTRLTPSDSPSTATGRAGRTRTPSGTAAWTTTCRTSCMRACASRATS